MFCYTIPYIQTEAEPIFFFWQGRRESPCSDMTISHKFCLYRKPDDTPHIT